jgi:hypothetical protein
MIPFHRVLISTAIAFCGGFALWSGWSYHADPSLGTLIVGGVFALAAVVLVYYLRHLNRFLGR